MLSWPRVAYQSFLTFAAIGLGPEYTSVLEVLDIIPAHARAASDDFIDFQEGDLRLPSEIISRLSRVEPLNITVTGGPSMPTAVMADRLRRELPHADVTVLQGNLRDDTETRVLAERSIQLSNSTSLPTGRTVVIDYLGLAQNLRDAMAAVKGEEMPLGELSRAVLEYMSNLRSMLAPGGLLVLFKPGGILDTELLAAMAFRACNSTDEVMVCRKASAEERTDTAWGFWTSCRLGDCRQQRLGLSVGGEWVTEERACPESTHGCQLGHADTKTSGEDLVRTHTEPGQPLSVEGPLREAVTEGEVGDVRESPPVVETSADTLFEEVASVVSIEPLTVDDVAYHETERVQSISIEASAVMRSGAGVTLNEDEGISEDDHGLQRATAGEPGPSEAQATQSPSSLSMIQGEPLAVDEGLSQRVEDPTLGTGRLEGFSITTPNDNGGEMADAPKEREVGRTPEIARDGLDEPLALEEGNAVPSVATSPYDGEEVVEGGALSPGEVDSTQALDEPGSSFLTVGEAPQHGGQDSDAQSSSGKVTPSTLESPGTYLNGMTKEGSPHDDLLAGTPAMVETAAAIVVNTARIVDYGEEDNTAMTVDYGEEDNTAMTVDYGEEDNTAMTVDYGEEDNLVTDIRGCEGTPDGQCIDLFS
ncbi:hypothetical protein FOZ61_000328 [Perkinsus olseni]|uniref:Uncharacterized protein n=1 Tax=Perkinsus olseni TaxID=32597 RepID=A0A7J6M1J3_PEROL|nr:hypothetical protein FOZ61_000328 [Perkinsus olseni]